MRPVFDFNDFEAKLEFQDVSSSWLEAGYARSGGECAQVSPRIPEEVHIQQHGTSTFVTRAWACNNRDTLKSLAARIRYHSRLAPLREQRHLGLLRRPRVV